jgi:hypothetical protein
MRRLLAAVVPVDEPGHGIEIMRVHGRSQPVDHFGHQASPTITGYAVPEAGHGPCRCSGT